VTTTGVPLGITDIQVWSRPPADFGKAAQRHLRLITEKESQKWLHSYYQTAIIQAQIPTPRAVVIGDRESDIYELFELIPSNQIPTTPDGRRPELLIRAAQYRRVRTADDTIQCLWTFMEQQSVAGTYKIKILRKGSQRARTAKIQIRFAPVTILPPKNQAPAGRQPITLWAVWPRKNAHLKTSNPSPGCY
jgi:hypothetical protein